MPRTARSQSHAPGIVLHVISRFAGGDFLLTTDALRRRFMRRAVREIAETDWVLLAYALMSSHVHWLFLTGCAALANIFHPLNTWFAGFVNASRGSFGPVFAGRPVGIRIEGESCASAIAYIHNNPVRAGVVRHASESAWTSHRAYLGLAQPSPCLDTSLGMRLSGFESSATGRCAFDSFVKSFETDPRQIRFSGLPVQPTDFSALAEAAIEQARLSLGVERGALRAGSKNPLAVEGRRLALVAWARHLSLPTAHLARALGLSRAGASYLLRTSPGGSIDERARALAEVLASGTCHLG